MSLAEIVNWTKANLGTTIPCYTSSGARQPDLDGQCVTYIKKVCELAGVSYASAWKARGHAKDWGVAAVRDGIASEVAITNRVDGDILIQTSGTYGHIAMYYDNGVYESNITPLKLTRRNNITGFNKCYRLNSMTPVTKGDTSMPKGGDLLNGDNQVIEKKLAGYQFNVTNIRSVNVKNEQGKNVPHILYEQNNYGWVWANDTTRPNEPGDTMVTAEDSLCGIHGTPYVAGAITASLFKWKQFNTNDGKTVVAGEQIDGYNGWFKLDAGYFPSAYTTRPMSVETEPPIDPPKPEPTPDPEIPVEPEPEVIDPPEIKELQIVGGTILIKN